MLYMKEMRAEVQSQCTLKESAAINQILGKKVGLSCQPVFVFSRYCVSLPANILFVVYSGTHWTAKSKPSITRWLSKNGEPRPCQPWLDCQR